MDNELREELESTKFAIDANVKDELDKMFAGYCDRLKEQAAAAQAGNKALADSLREENEKREADIAATIKKLQDEQAKTRARILDLEQKGTPSPSAEALRTGLRTIGQTFVESEQYKSAMKAGLQTVGEVNVGDFFPRPGATAIVNATGQNQPLVPAQRLAGIYQPTAERQLTIRDLLPVGQATSNLIEFAKENVFTNSAAPQGDGSSPQVYENVAKAESGITFTLAYEAIQTIAHWIPASKQVLQDATMLQGYVNARLTYGLKLVEETQLLLGDGTGANLNGLVTQATAYNAALDVANDTRIDKLRHAILQAVADSEFIADGIVMSHTDWHTIELIKVNAGTDDRYVYGNPANPGPAMIWGLPVVKTNSLTVGKFLVGAFLLAAQIWDRMQNTIEVSREHSDYFVKNMVAILAEERIALTVYRPKALIYGSF